MGNVLLIGGSPMIGKSTVARKISSIYELQNLSTDDIGEMLQTAVDINPMKGMNYLDYYENVDVDMQIKDLQEYHKKMSDAILKMIQIHSNWGHSMVIEGYAIYPEIAIDDSHVDGIWLIASEDLLVQRLKQSKAFQSASDKARNNYLKRSLWHNRFLEKQCKLHNRKYIKIDGTEAAEEIVETIINRISITF